MSRPAPVFDHDVEIRNGNKTRSLLVGKNYKVIDCTSSNCEEERRGLWDEDIVAVIPSPELRLGLPSDNYDTVPTGGALEKLLLPSKWCEVSPEHAVATARF